MRKIQLGDLCDFINGGNWKEKEYSSFGIPVVQVSNMKNDTIDISNLKYLSKNRYDQYKKHSLKINDLIIATVGSHPTQGSAAGRAIIVKDFAVGMLLNQNAVVIRSKSNLAEQKFVGLIGRSKKFQLYLNTIGQGAANQVRIPLSGIKKYICHLPPIKDQKIISSMVFIYDDLIDINQRRIQLLEDTARLLYREWFVYFRFPSHENVKMIDGIPEGWKKDKLNKYVEFKRGVEPGSKNYLENNKMFSYPFFRVSDLVSRDPEIYVDELCIKGALLEKKDIVVSLDGSVGIVSMGLEGSYSTGIRKLIIKNDHINRGFLYCLMKSKYVQGIIKAYSKGTTIQHAGESVKNIKPLMPTKGLMDRFGEISEPMIDEILILLEQNQKLAQARDLLLPRLMSGKIDVSEFDKDSISVESEVEKIVN